ncbi:MAG TPA: protein kinase, partial [Polyangia bacterium]
MGVVYEALDQERNTHVALKTLRTREPRAILRLKHEFRALRDLQHGNLVSFGELFESGGDWFFTMELVRGVDLLSWVRAKDGGAPGDTPEEPSTATVAGTANKAPSKPWPTPPPSLAAPFDEARLRDALRQLGRGLTALHDGNRVHRDI